MPTRTARRLTQIADDAGRCVVRAVHPRLGTRYLYCEGDVPLLFTENETNTQRLFGVPNQSPYVKDGINDYHRPRPRRRGEPGEDRNQRRRALPPDHRAGRVRRSCACGCRDLAPGAPARTTPERSLRRRIRRVVESRRQEAMPSTPRSCRRRSVPTARTSCARRWPACCGRNSSTTTTWTMARRSTARIPSIRSTRRRRATTTGTTCTTRDVISMPDKWEYPWYAAWDLAFHVLGADPRRPRLRQAATESAAAASTTCTPTGRCPRTNGTSATSIRPCMPGRRSSPTASTRRRPASATRSG